MGRGIDRLSDSNRHISPFACQGIIKHFDDFVGFRIDKTFACGRPTGAGAFGSQGLIQYAFERCPEHDRNPHHAGPDTPYSAETAPPISNTVPKHKIKARNIYAIGSIIAAVP